MYSLFRGVYDLVTQKKEYNIAILGLDNAGKTTLLEKIRNIYTGKKGLSPDKIIPTIGLNIIQIDIGNGIVLKFWDLGGDKSLRRLWRKYYEDCHSVLFVIDSTLSGESRLYDEGVGTYDEVISKEELEGVPFVIGANKRDLKRPIKVFSISALTGDGIKILIEWLLVEMENNNIRKPPSSTR